MVFDTGNKKEVVIREPPGQERAQSGEEERVWRSGRGGSRVVQKRKGLGQGSENAVHAPDGPQTAWNKRASLALRFNKPLFV